jgi:hypothetical protein
MCQKLEIPVKYYRRLADEMKATVANYDINRLNGHSYLLRVKGDWIRAFLSAEYVVYNNSEITETVQSLAREWRSYNEVLCPGRDAYVFENHLR